MEDEQFVLLVKREDEILQRLLELERKFDEHNKVGDYCPHTLR